MICETTDYMYPLLADVYYSIVDQGAYGNVKKQWVLDKTIACAFAPAGRKFKQDVQPNVNITLDNILVGRTRNDILTSDRESLVALTNIIITNIRDKDGNIILNESAGIRAGKATLYEVSTFMPIVGPFGKTEYYKVVIARSENQAADV